MSIVFCEIYEILRYGDDNLNQRIILHSDLNSFYASVEMMLDPALKGKAVAVCGSTDDRHGIVLAKSELAKKAGVKTGMVTWEARRLCPDLIIAPPQYNQYLKYSKLTREIYERYTDKVEPYGMDECWLDLTGSTGLFGDGETIANQIRCSVKEELGLSVSIGVSFNKIFAKLGSDIKKPDAVTVITKENYREKIWGLPVGDLFYVGRATNKKLSGYGIHTIGELANTKETILKNLFGKHGTMLFAYANGLDNSDVMKSDYSSQIKSVGHGITSNADLLNGDEVWKVILELSQDIGHKLRLNNLSACGVSLTVKDKELSYKQYQTQLEFSTQSSVDIAKKANELFNQNYIWVNNVRALTVRAINLIQKEENQQLSIYEDIKIKERKEKLECVVEDIRRRFGNKAVFNAVLMGNIKIPKHSTYELVMPGMIGRV